ncbi:MAG: peptidylprolyl isomerase [Bacteroidota bacterium]
MIRLIPILLLVAGCSVLAAAQPSRQEEERRRREKLETILRVKDLRTPHDGKLLELLSDADPIVREEATLAFGSIQDTTVIGPLTRNLTDPVIRVQRAAAFALGQTGLTLSPTGRRNLEYDLIWKRLHQTLVFDRLIEEIGKFGTEEGLNELIIKVANRHALQARRGLTMCIARFAIRDIVSDDAVRYLLRYVRPAEETRWEVVYALRRIGDHPVIRDDLDHLALLWRHRDPNVRMNLALLLGELKEPTASLEPLMNMAQFDGDWRVRVNSTKALSDFPILDTARRSQLFKELFFDRNHHVSLTALSSFPGLGLDTGDSLEIVQETFYQLKYIARNASRDFHWQLQGEAAVSYAKLAGPEAFESVADISETQPYLGAYQIKAAAHSGAKDAAGFLLDETRDPDPVRSCAALEGLQIFQSKHPDDVLFRDEARQALIGSLGAEDVAVVATAAYLLRDPLFRDPAVVQPLLRALPTLHIQDDREAILEIFSTLAEMKDTRAILPLRDQLKRVDRQLGMAAAEALEAITGHDYSNQVPNTERALFTDFDFAYLRSLPDTVTVRIETIRGDITAELYKTVAPFTVMNILKLASHRGFYNGLNFHRVVPNFVVQGGDPRGDGWGGPGYTIRSEFSTLSYLTGAIGMASAGKDTEGSQFFITHSPQPHLDGRYTLFGRVVSGQGVVNRLLIDDRLFNISPAD